MSLLRNLADRRRRGSLSNWFRKRRSRHLAALLHTVPAPFDILDIGGEQVFWDEFPLPAGVDVTLLNLEPSSGEGGTFTFIAADARNLSQFADGSWDVVVSNSVIEHVGTPADQRAMAREVRRVARRYYVQTPNRRFPIDPHFLIPFFHLLPRGVMVWWLMRFDAGWFSAARERNAAEQLVDSVSLLSAAELRKLFPDARLWRERFCGLTKSLIVYEGWDESNSRSRSGSDAGSRQA